MAQRLLGVALALLFVQAVVAQSPCSGSGCRAPPTQHFYTAELKHDEQRVLADADVKGTPVSDPVGGDDQPIIVEAEAVEKLCRKRYASENSVSENSESARRACRGESSESSRRSESSRLSESSRSESARRSESSRRSESVRSPFGSEASRRSERSETARRSELSKELSKGARRSESSLSCRRQYAARMGVTESSAAAFRACSESTRSEAARSESSLFKRLFGSEAASRKSTSGSESAHSLFARLFGESSRRSESGKSESSKRAESSLFARLFGESSRRSESGKGESSRRSESSLFARLFGESSRRSESGKSESGKRSESGRKSESASRKSESGKKSESSGSDSVTPGNLESKIHALEERLLDEQKKSAAVRAKLLLSDGEASKAALEASERSEASRSMNSLLVARALASLESSSHKSEESSGARLQELKTRITALIKDLKAARATQDSTKVADLSSQLKQLSKDTSRVRDAVKERIAQKRAEIDRDGTLTESSKQAAKKALESSAEDELKALSYEASESSGESAASLKSMVSDLKNLAKTESSLAKTLQSLKKAGFPSESSAIKQQHEMTQLAISREVSEISAGISELKRMETDLAKAQKIDDEKLRKAIRQMQILRSEASDVSLGLKSKQDLISTDVNSVKRREDRVENVVRELYERVKQLENALDYMPGAKLRSESGSSEISVRESSESGRHHESARRSESSELTVPHRRSESSSRQPKRRWVKKWVKKRKGPESSEEVSEEVSSEETEESSEESSTQEVLNNAISRVKSFFNKVLARKHKL